MLVGDAAHHVNPVTGGGITSGMTAGWIAGQVAADSVRKNDASEKFLTAYSEWVHKEFGKKYERVYKIKEAISKLTDEDLNNIKECKKISEKEWLKINSWCQENKMVEPRRIELLTS